MPKIRLAGKVKHFPYTKKGRDAIKEIKRKVRRGKA